MELEDMHPMKLFLYAEAGIEVRKSEPKIQIGCHATNMGRFGEFSSGYFCVLEKSFCFK